MVISKGKIIKIKKGGGDILEGYSPMTLDSELTVSFTSTFESLVGDSTGKALTLVSGAARALKIGSVTGKFKEMGYKIWTGTSPVQFTFRTTFNMKTSALEDVMKPSSKIIKLCLPSQGVSEKNEIGLVAPGPSLFAILENSEIGKSENYSIRIGAFYLPQIIIETVEPTYASDVDEDGFPIWCTLQVTVTSLFTATTDMIENFNYRVEE